MKIPYLLKRTVAYLIDSSLGFGIAMLLIQWAILKPLRPLLGINDEFFKQSWNMEIYVLLTISLPVYLFFTFFDSSTKMGTPGKLLFRLKVTDSEGTRLSFKKALIRSIVKLLPWEIAHIGIIFPMPVYYTENPEIRMLSIVGLFIMLIYFISIAINKKSLSLYDQLIGTQVVRKVTGN